MISKDTNVQPTRTPLVRKSIQLHSRRGSQSHPYRQIFTQKHRQQSKTFIKEKPRQILSFLNRKKLNEFIKLLKNEKDDINFFYPASSWTPRPGTLLDIACRSAGNQEFVRILLNSGAQIDLVNKQTGKAPLHEAVLSSDKETVQILRQHVNCNVNILDQEGNSALHYAVSKNQVDIIQILLQNPSYDDGGTGQDSLVSNDDHLAIDFTDGTRHPTNQKPIKPNQLIDVNVINQLNQTPLHLALNEQNGQVIDILLDHPDIDIDAQKNLDGLSCRQIITDEYPKLKPKISNIPLKYDGAESLFSLLHKRDTESFIKQIQLSRPSSTITNGKNTYLQYACKYGLFDVARALLDVGVNPNKYSVMEKQTPLMMACYQGYHEIALMLLDHPGISFDPIECRTVLHAVMTGMVHALGCDKTKPQASKDDCDHYQCLRYILEQVVRKGKVDINYADENGDTALHLAALLNDYQVLKDLLDEGAYIGQKNHSGVEPLLLICPSMLKQYLDSCISFESHPLRENFKIILNYKLLMPPVASKDPEMESLAKMSNDPDLRKLLQHPLLMSFLDLKWQAFKIYAYVNLFFYSVFWVILNVYFYYYFFAVVDEKPNEITDHTREFPQHLHILRYLAYLLSWMLLLRELYQFLLSPKLYLTSLINYLEMTMVSIIAIFLTFQATMATHLNMAKILASLVIFLSCLELVTLVGRLPMFSSNLTLLRTVLASCLKFIAWYSIILFGCAYSLHILTIVSTPDPLDALHQPITFFYNASLMLTGSFNAPTITDDASLKLYNFIFLSVIFLAPIINGIALGGINQVEEEVELLGTISRIKSTFSTESMVNNDACGLLQGIDKLVRWFLHKSKLSSHVHEYSRYSIVSDKQHKQMFYRRIKLADYIRPSCKIAVSPKQHNVVLLPIVTSEDGSLQHEEHRSHFEKTAWVIDSDIVQDMESILEKRMYPDDDDDFDQEKYEKELMQLGLRLQAVENSVENVEKSIQSLISIVKSKYE
ncbi:transient receptor potential cation channel protein painless-like [Planococcus citri]|uniref:transient receptor potential cation channel protein painless-like n=1 Tax=Planococcus citri TaxID=170843 RepID=UPI0031F992CD